MVALLQRNPLLTVLAGLAVLLLLVLGIELGFGTSLHHALPEENVRRAPQPEAKLLPPLAAADPERAYPETGERPLFTPTRRQAPAAAATTGALVKGQFTLQGVIAVGDHRIAMLREKANGRIHRVEQGKEVNGITVSNIEREAVTLALGGDQEVLSLQVQKAGTTPAATSPAGGPFPSQFPPGVPTPAGSSPLLNAPRPVPGQPSGAAIMGGGIPPQGPGSVAPRVPAAAAGQTASQPMSPEELLARRRARRGQTTQ